MKAPLVPPAELSRELPKVDGQSRQSYNQRLHKQSENTTLCVVVVFSIHKLGLKGSRTYAKK